MKYINKIFTIVSFFLIPVILYYGVMLINNNHPDFEGVPKYIIKANIILLTSYILILLNFLLKKKYIISIIMIVISLYSLIVFLHRYEVYKHSERYSINEEDIIQPFYFFDLNNQSKGNLNTNPIVDTVNMLNSRGEKVDKFVKGTFKIIDTGEIFEYQERYNLNHGDLRSYNDNTVNDCINKNCEIVYFEKADNNEQKRVALFSDKDTIIEGVIKDVKFYINEKEILNISNPINRDTSVVYNISDNKDLNFVFREDLCVDYKGGDFQCYSPRFKKGDKVFTFFDGTPNGLYLTSNLVKSKLISYQYYVSPDTGEVFPVIER